LISQNVLPFVGFCLVVPDMPTGERAKGVPLTMTFGSTMSGDSL
jgi:hypothetical protein